MIATCWSGDPGYAPDEDVEWLSHYWRRLRAAAKQYGVAVSEWLDFLAMDDDPDALLGIASEAA